MASKLSSSFDDLLNENRNQMDSLFGKDRVASRPAVAPTPSPVPPAPSQAASVVEVAESTSAQEPTPPASQSGRISGTAKGIPFSLKVSG